MKRTLTLTFEFDDSSLVFIEDGEEYLTDAFAFAMDQVNGVVPYAAGANFVDAKLDGDILVDGNGYVSDEVKRCNRQLACH